MRENIENSEQIHMAAASLQQKQGDPIMYVDRPLTHKEHIIGQTPSIILNNPNKVNFIIRKLLQTVEIQNKFFHLLVQCDKLPEVSQVHAVI